MQPTDMQPTDLEAIRGKVYTVKTRVSNVQHDIPTGTAATLTGISHNGDWLLTIKNCAGCQPGDAHAFATGPDHLKE